MYNKWRSFGFGRRRALTLLVMALFIGPLLAGERSAPTVLAAALPGAAAVGGDAPLTTQSGPLLLLGGAHSPNLQQLGAQMTATNQSLAATDEGAMRRALGAAGALGVDLATVNLDTLHASRWFNLAHRLNVPMILEHADGPKVAAITGYGQSGDLVLLRPSAGGSHVQMTVFAPSAAASPDALVAQVVTLLDTPTTTGALPNPDSLPMGAKRIWDVEAVLYLGPNQIIFSHQKQFQVPSSDQTYTDDVNFSVGLYAASDKKWLVVDLAGGSGVNAGTLANNSDTDRGWYLESYSVDMAPSHSAVLPPNFTLYKTAPEAAVSSGSYSTSSGFSIGPSTDGTVAAQFQLGQTNTVNLTDFSVQNFSAPTGAHWKFVLSSVGVAQPYNSWPDLVYGNSITQIDPTKIGKLLSLPGIAAGQTLQPQTEAVWAAPVDFQGTVPFILSHQSHFRHVYKPSGATNYQSTAVDGAIFFADPWIDFSQVNYVGNLAIAPQDITVVQDPASSDPTHRLLRAVVHTSQADYQAVKVTFYAGQQSSGTQLGAATIAVLASNGSYQGVAEIPWTPTVPPGTQSVYVTVEPQPGETNGNDNAAVQDLNLVAPQISVDQSSLAVTEGGATATVGVHLATKPGGTVYVVPQPDSHLTATPDFVTFDGTNWNTPQTFTIAAVDDTIVEGPYSGQLAFLASGDAAYQGVKTAPINVAITDNDNVSPLVVQVAEGGYADSYQFRLVRKPTAPVQVGIGTDGQTTVMPTSLTFTVDNWNKPQYVVVRAVDDTTAQGTHSSTISHTASSADASYNNVALSSVTATVLDNDGPLPTIDVNTAADVVANDGLCALREAIAAANANARVNDCNVQIADYHIINLTVAGPYEIAIPLDPNFATDSAPVITSNIVLNARGQTIRNHADSGISRIFTINSGGNLTINDATLRDGKAFGGGALWIDVGGTVNLFHSNLIDNTALAPASAGAIVNKGTLNVFDTVIANNVAQANNQANSGRCGAICNEGLLNMANSIISGNSAGDDGGAIYTFYNSTTNLTNVTITGNTTDNDSNGSGAGGGILMAGGAISLKNSIIAGNFDTPNNAGPDATTPDITSRNDDPTFAYVGLLVSGGYNLIGNIGAYNFTASTNGDLYGDPNQLTTPHLGATAASTPVDPMLSAPSGGSLIYALQPTSPALDRIPAANCTFLGASGNPLFAAADTIQTDIVGAPRPSGLNCDVGAVEMVVARAVASTQTLSVPTGNLGSIYQVVLATQPTANVTVNIVTDGATMATPDQLVFTPANWNQAQTVTIVAVASAINAAQTTTSSVIKHTVSSTDQNYNGSTIPDIQSTIVQVGPPPANPALTIVPSTLPTGTAGSPYTQQLTVIGGAAPYQFELTAGALPDGLRLIADGQLTGTPADESAASFVVSVRDANGLSAKQGFDLQIAAAPVASALLNIRPIVECIFADGNGGFIANFGYRNNNTIPVTMTVGANNFFTPAPDGQGQPTIFLPGRQQRVVNIPLKGDAVSWTLIGPNGHKLTATATAKSKFCKKPITVTIGGLTAANQGAGNLVSTGSPEVTLDWVSDEDDVGVTYNLLRSRNPSGPWTQVNARPLVPANGHCLAPDQPGLGDFYYTIENIDPDGEISWFNADAVTIGDTATTNQLYLPLVLR